MLNHLKETFTIEKMLKVFPDANLVRLFGEGYGSKIQACGGKYRKDQSFILFDCIVNGWWLNRRCQRYRRCLGNSHGSRSRCYDRRRNCKFCRSKPLSRISHEPLEIEGVMCRSQPLMNFRNGLPIMWKLKCKDLK